MKPNVYKRNGFTLIELMMTITVGSTLLILAVGLVHQAMSFGSQSRDQADQARSRNRLATAFRQDVQQAKSCQIDSDQQLNLSMADGSQVTYLATANQVSRTQPLDNGQTRHESFEFSAISTIVFERLSEPDLAVLTIVRSLPTAETRIESQVAAVIGRRQMLQQAEVSQ